MFMPLIVGVLSSREDLVWRMALLLVVGMVLGSGLAWAALEFKSLPLLFVGRLLTG